MPNLAKGEIGTNVRWGNNELGRGALQQGGMERRGKLLLRTTGLETILI
jgi:hypothetical protein